MNIKFGKTKKEFTLISILVAVVIIVVYFQLFFRPTMHELLNILPTVSLLETELTDAKKLIAMKPRLEEQRKILQEKMDGYKKVFPSQHEVTKFLGNLSDIATESKVKIIGIRPLAPKKSLPEEKAEQLLYGELSIEIIAKSGYHELGRFLQRLECGETFIMIKDIDIEADPRNVKRHNVRLIASTFTLTER